MQSHGDPQADFLAAYDTLADAIFRHCYFRLRNRELAVDLMQDTFMKTWEYMATGKEVKNLKAFLYKTANNLIIDTVRRQKRRTEESLETLQEETGFDLADEDTIDDNTRLDAAAVAETLAKVEEPYRSAVIMRYIDELSPKEIAAVTGESANVISVRINRGIQQLRSFLPGNE